jgi:hypothetical protein
LIQKQAPGSSVQGGFGVVAADDKIAASLVLLPVTILIQANQPREGFGCLRVRSALTQFRRFNRGTTCRGGICGWVGSLACSGFRRFRFGAFPGGDGQLRGDQKAPSGSNCLQAQTGILKSESVDSHSTETQSLAPDAS